MDRAVSPLTVRLQEFKDGKGLSQAELSRRSGVPQSTICRIEARETGSISLRNLEKLLIVHEPRARRG